MSARTLGIAIVLAAVSGHAAASPAARPAPAPTASAEVEVVVVPAQPILFRTIRARPADLDAAMRAAILSLLGTATQHGLELDGPPLARYVSRGTADDPTLVVDAALPLQSRPKVKLGPGVRIGSLPAGPAAVVLHAGRFEQLPQAHARLDAWLVANGRRAAGPRWERYLTNPITTPEPDAQRTKVFVPLAAN